MSGQSLFDKLWERHLVVDGEDGKPAVLYIDLHLIHEVTSPQAFAELEQRGLPVVRPDRCLATIDHSTPTLPVDENGELPYVTEQARQQVDTLRQNCKKHGISLHDWDSPYRGIVHVIGPELGATQPGMTIVCGDSHTSTHGAFGALAFGIGTTEVGHVLATQCLLQHKPKSMNIRIDGQLPAGVTAKDVILHVIGEIGVNGGTGMVIEYSGSAVEAMDMEARMTLCNMSIECGARAGFVAPDQTTFDYLKGKTYVPTGKSWAAQCAEWRQLRSDRGAHFDWVVNTNAEEIRPTITYGTHPGMVHQVDSLIPDGHQDPSFKQAMDYMGFKPGEQVQGKPVDVVFIGSCTNARLSDLRMAADIMRHRKVQTRTLVVPGSVQVKQQAEAEGLDQVFLDAGAEWREPGCSMCIAMNGDFAHPGELVVSTSNRNFQGRQGPGSRTLLASPLTAAACAVEGRVTNPLQLMPYPRKVML